MPKSRYRTHRIYLLHNIQYETRKLRVCIRLAVLGAEQLSAQSTSRN